LQQVGANALGDGVDLFQSVFGRFKRLERLQRAHFAESIHVTVYA